MPTRPTHGITLRKSPRQARSAHLVSTILEAAVRVLEEVGATNFTTARVAERAGVSVGSLYQYFPNKAAILFRLQSDEWKTTNNLLTKILKENKDPWPEKLQKLVHAFILSECDEAAIRSALDDAAPLYRDAPEAADARQSATVAFHEFMQAALPHIDNQSRAIAHDLILNSMSNCAKHFSEQQRSADDIDSYATQMATMFCAYIEKLRHDA